jgi:hypothetical protein
MASFSQSLSRSQISQPRSYVILARPGMWQPGLLVSPVTNNRNDKRMNDNVGRPLTSCSCTNFHKFRDKSSNLTQRSGDSGACCRPRLGPPILEWWRRFISPSGRLRACGRKLFVEASLVHRASMQNISLDLGRTTALGF